MRIASWNINSIRVRQDRLAEWLQSRAPDVLCLQEIKTVDSLFPGDAFRALGYEVAVFGQKAYNGVAILSRLPLLDVVRGFAVDPAAEQDPDDPEARLLAATVGGIRVHSVYVPNGQTIDSDRYAHKLRWLAQLGAHVGRLGPTPPLLFCGDFNVAPEERDLYRPEAFARDVIFHEDVRKAYQALVGRGLVDTFRLHNPDPGHYSWWDYRMLAFAKNRGLRIDLILASAALARRCVASGIDREARKGSLPSDHAPIWAEFAEAADLLDALTSEEIGAAAPAS